MPHKSAWLDAGWRTTNLNQNAGHVLFVRNISAPNQFGRALQPVMTISPPRSTQTLNVPHAWDGPKILECRIRLAWLPLGRVELGLGSKLVFPMADAVPALYRFRIRRADTEKCYIGQTENLSRRLGLYRNPGPSQQTNIRLNAEMVQALAAGAEIGVSAVTADAWIDRGAGPVPADLSSVATRCLLENAAILESAAIDVEALNR
jgi:hypothetical protein